MQLRGIDFGNILGASGVQGFFGEGYWFHPLLKPFGMDLSEVTFVSKTATLLARKGNASLTRHYTLRNPFPDCIKAKPLKGAMLNAVGLSNPGLGALLGANRWQQRTKPFWISIMSLASTPAERLQELRIMIDMLRFCKKDFKVPFGLQINLSCPNTGHDPKELMGEIADVLDVANLLGMPVMPKFSIASASVRAVLELNKYMDCDAICVSNTVPYDWEGIGARVWGSLTSPLARYGGGGLSGAALRPLVCAWITELRAAGFTKPINGGGGILSTADVDHYRAAGASSVFLGTVTTQRSWRVLDIIAHANTIDWR